MMTNPVESGCKGLHYMIENPYIYTYTYLGGDFICFLCSSLNGKMIQFD